MLDVRTREGSGGGWEATGILTGSLNQSRVVKKGRRKVSRAQSLGGTLGLRAIARSRRFAQNERLGRNGRDSSAETFAPHVEGGRVLAGGELELGP